MMTDSNSDDSDDASSNIFTFQDQIQNIRVKGPNISNFNISKLPIGQAHNGRARYAESLCDQRRSYRDRRETSPMSVYSASSLQHQNFQQSMYRGAIGSQHSMYNARFGSSMSVRSFDSNATFSAADVTQALNNQTFNIHGMRMIKNAVDKYFKKGSRNRIQKKRRKRFRNTRRRSGYDSGEQGSVSSVSSDDAMSVRTTRSAFPDSSSSCRSTKTDYTHFRRTMKDSGMYKDCTDNFRQNAFKSIMSSAPENRAENINNHRLNAINQRPHNYSAMNQKDRFRNGFLLPSQRFNQYIASSSIPENQHKQDTNDYSSSYRNKTNNPTKNNQHDNHDKLSASENEEIFSSNTIAEQSTSRTNDYLTKRRFNNNQVSVSKNEEIYSLNTTAEQSTSRTNDYLTKRKFNNEDDDTNSLPPKKRNKLTSPQKSFGTKNRPQKQCVEKTAEKKTCDFVFAKPQLPLKKTMCINKTLKPVQQQQKSTTVQPNEKLKLNVDSSQVLKRSASEPATVLSKKQPVNAVDKLIVKSNPHISEPQPAEQIIAMSTQPLDDVVSPKPTRNNCLNNISQEKDQVDQSAITQLSTTDMSMRPSFIKRKLFSQKAEIADKNASSDTIEENSPQSNMYSMIQKEKNRTRKLVTSQSCMNRDLGDESNLLDLIHKIVPAEQMNLTSATNRTDIKNKSKPENNTANKWDVTLASTDCNNDEGSDTYTEEIFETNETVIKPKTTTTKSIETLTENLPKQMANKSRPSPIKNPKVNSLEENGGKQKTSSLKKCVKSFWDSDEESDTGNNSSSEKTIIDVVPVSVVLENNIPLAKLASSNTKQTKKSENKSSKPSQTKQDNNSKGTASNNKAVTKSTSVANKQSINTQAKQKVTKDMTTKDNVAKLTNKKSTNSNQHNDKEKKVYDNVINKTLRIRKCRTSKINRCCEVPLNNVSTTDIIQPLTRSLRTREIDISMSVSSGPSGRITPLKDIPKRKGRPRKNKLIAEVENKENVSNQSDISFTLTMDKNIVTRRTKSKINGGLSDISKRPRDISSSLNDAKHLNKTGMTTRSSERSRTESKMNHEVTTQKRMPISSTNRSILKNKINK